MLQPEAVRSCLVRCASDESRSVPFRPDRNRYPPRGSPEAVSVLRRRDNRRERLRAAYAAVPQTRSDTIDDRDGAMSGCRRRNGQDDLRLFLPFLRRVDGSGACVRLLSGMRSFAGAESLYRSGVNVCRIPRCAIAA